MTAAFFLTAAVRPALSLLPPAMRSPEAEALLVAISHQESRLRHRYQIGGPAKGYAQFELAGVLAVVNHAGLRLHAISVLRALDYHTGENVPPYLLHQALQHNDVLTAAFARLLLWAVPGPLPTADEPERGWQVYLSAWRPGKPRPESWAEAWSVGWSAVGGTERRA